MTTATTSLSLADEIRAYMRNDADDVAWTTCEDCGESVHQSYAEAHDGYCPRCAHRSAVESAKDDVSQAKDELQTLLDEMKELRERIAEQQATLAAARENLATLKARKK